MKGKNKTQKGITLIALIITIVVLLILAAVAISSIQNDGILHYAQNAADSWNRAQANEANMLGDYLNYLNNMGSGNSGGADIDVTDDATMSAKTTNTKIEDIYGNKITIPAGFKISVDNTGYTKETLDVTKGIVIEDVTKDASGNPTSTTGNQFVWIPIGIINHLDENGEETTSNITLGRYSWSGSTGTLVQPTADNPYTSNVSIASSPYTYTEYQSTSSTSNAKASNINDFYESVMGTDSKEGNGGYYLGRYEAGDSSNTAVANRTGTSGTSTPGTLVCKANQVTYNWILQSDASSACQNMYEDGYSDGTFSSDLINSYAWDTAIVFIQSFGTKSNSSTYASTIGRSSIDINTPQLTGVNRLSTVTDNPIDEQLNIFDMAGNCIEWSTETYGYGSANCVWRGGNCYGTSISAATRNNYSSTTSFHNAAFRPLIYVGL